MVLYILVYHRLLVLGNGSDTAIIYIIAVMKSITTLRESPVDTDRHGARSCMNEDFYGILN